MKKEKFSERKGKTNSDPDAIAIVGMSCRFPDADNTTQFWHNLEHGVNSITELSPERWSPDDYTESDKQKKPINRCGQLKGVRNFDNQFFNISPREANHMDPQQRLLLEETWKCIEDSGIVLKKLQESQTSVIVGVMTVDYKQVAVMPDVDTDSYTCLGTYECILANRISYMFGLKGQSYSINAACASSLIILHEAKRILQKGECKYSIAAGVNLSLHPQKFVSLANMMSQESQCKTFDRDANGYVPGEGVGVLLLQKLEDAIKEGNHIYGILKGSAVNHTGKSKSLTAPSVEGQQELITSAYKDAGITPEQTTYTETHGTGTSLGDPIEIEALTRAFEKASHKKGYCYVGSVKTNIGHLEGAAGIAGAIKVLLMLKNKKIPPSLNLKNPNPFIDFDHSPFKVNTELEEWNSPAKDIPLRAGVSSFGFGGSNAHVIFEEFIDLRKRNSKKTENFPFTLSAKSSKSLKEMIDNWISYLGDIEFVEQNYEDIFKTLITGRENFPFRIGQVIENREELISFLNDAKPINFAKSIDKNWILQINEISIEHPSVINRLSGFHIYKQHLKQALSELNKIEGGKERCIEFESQKWRDENKTVFSFIYNHILLATVIELGLKPERITATKEGLWNALVLSGIVDFNDMLNYLTGTITFSDISFHRPTIPFFDMESKKMIRPYRFDRSYICSLMNDINALDPKIFDTAFTLYINKSRSLYTNQNTFKKYVINWHSIVMKAGLDIEKMLFDETYFQTESNNCRNEKMLLLIIVISSILKVEKKWGLKENIQVDHSGFCELIHLVVDTVMPEDMLVNILLGEELDYDQLSSVLESEQAKMSHKHPYEHIKSYSSEITELEINEQWANSILKSKANLNIADHETVLIISNEKNNPDSSRVKWDVGNLTRESFLKRILDIWIQGVDIDWTKLYPESEFIKCSLPTYSFDKEKTFWIPSNSNKKEIQKRQTTFSDFDNPLLQRNCSDLQEQRFCSILTGQEFFLTDHVIKGDKIMPGVAFLEMAVSAMDKAASFLKNAEKRIGLRNVIWTRPLIVHDEPIRVDIKLAVQDKDDIRFEVFCPNPAAANERTEHCQGRIGFYEVETTQTIDLPTLKKQCEQQILSGDHSYKELTSIGFHYGPTHQSIQILYRGEGQLLAQITLPNALADAPSGFYLHPSIMDAALQASVILMNSIGDKRFALPFALKSIEVLDKTTSTMWAMVRLVNNDLSEKQITKFDIDLCDDSGSICVRMKEFALKTVEQQGDVKNPFKLPESEAIQHEEKNRSETNEEGNLLNKIGHILTDNISHILKIDTNEIYADTEFSEYGFESITYTELVFKLNEAYKLDLNPTIFFEYSTLSALSKYLIEEYADCFAFLLQSDKTVENTPVVSPSILPQNRVDYGEKEPIAIVGMSGAFPMAGSLDEYWENLVNGRDCISEIPKNRWDWQEYTGRSKSKWGGFMENIDQFDPLFFGITPKEAELMDPSQRLLMTHTWKAIEDAGISAHSLSSTQTGLFIGTINSGYSNLMAKNGIADENYLSSGTVPSIGVNRMSYFLNIHGPSEPVETACSSSLVAIHRAIASIRDGSCDRAIAGGVQVIVTPDFHIKFSKAGMLCEDGRCKTFSNQANGYVRGEGVGIIMLKKLRDAEQSGDHIYGLIVGSAINHGGRSNSLTSPNTKAQTELIKQVYRDANIDPRSVTYIECHGTGTELGDPIEINALKTAFKELYHTFDGNNTVSNTCGIGSVKSNIGHLEYAAGIAGVMKVVLQLQHRTLVKSIHCDTINPYIQLDGTPFYVVQNNCEWKALQDTEGKNMPRRAGISSFGIGGVNAHIIIEEYTANNQANRRLDTSNDPNEKVTILLSAKNRDRLKDQSAQLQEEIKKQKIDNNLLKNIAYTLQIGREHMEERMAILVSSISELLAKLENFTDGYLDEDNVFVGRVKRNRKEVQTANEETDIAGKVTSLLKDKKYPELATLWIKGHEIEWEKLYGEVKPLKLSLPTYPFEKEHYWIPEIDHTNKWSPSIYEAKKETVKTICKTESVILSDLIQIVADLIKVKASHIDSETEFREYGFDSLIYIPFVEKLNAKYNLKLEPTIFFEYSTLKDLEGYIKKEWIGKEEEEEEDTYSASYHSKSECSAYYSDLASSPNEPIAIIGMSGKFPMAQDIHAFWENLCEGKDCITEIPKKRWNWEKYYGDPLKEINKTDIKWGGFIDDIDEFDPLFFGISPKEAEFMDPQQRLLMTYSWKAIEDAGYAAKSLAGSDTGVFIGTWNSCYTNWVMQSNTPVETYTGAAIVPSIGPSRVSYFLDFHGPSEPIETACSSSLVAIHRAVKSIREGECKLALAGGVNTIVAPELQISLNKSGMLSKDGRCKPFSDKANGYIRGEGAIIFLLKKLSEAEKSGDHIYGVILSSTQNHGGAANSLSSPNPKAQADLLINAYKKAGVDPRHVTYIEAHGTGTKLGDPIEIEGLKTAFQELYASIGERKIKTSHCGLGSVKSNIGHLEIAAGAAGVAKVLMQLKYKKLVKSIHCEKTNPYIDLNGTPFFIVKENRDWAALKDPEGKEIPRLAGVSSFGFGGVNAHVVIEEYVPETHNANPKSETSEIPVIIVLSAKNQETLKIYANEMIHFLRDEEQQPGNHVKTSLINMAYTLQIGRVAMEERIACIAKSKKDILTKLTQFVQGVVIENTVYQGNSKSNKAFLKQLLEGSEGEIYLKSVIQNNNLNKLAQLWVLGAEIEWSSLYKGEVLKRLSLPTYPFKKNHYWIPPVDEDVKSITQASQPKKQGIEKKVLILQSYTDNTDELQHSILKKYNSNSIYRATIGDTWNRRSEKEWELNGNNLNQMNEIIEQAGGINIIYVLAQDNISQKGIFPSTDDLINSIDKEKFMKYKIELKVISDESFLSYYPFNDR